MIARLYRIALGAFPKRHRDVYADEMLFAFEQQLESARRAGTLSAIKLVIAAMGNAIAMGMIERRRYRVVRLGHVFSALDFTLAWRMLLRYPGLSSVCVFGMAVGIAIAGGAFAVGSMLLDPSLPLPNGDRVVSLVNRDAQNGNNEFRLARDYQRWRDLTTIEDLGIARSVSGNLVIDGRAPSPASAAEMSASAFRVAGVNALRGRYLLPEDEAAGAPRAMVIGYDEWVRRFNGDPDVVGRSVQFGAEKHQIIGVMPDGFGFPTSHSLWISWRLATSALQPRSGPFVTVFGRLAAGVTLETAQAELTEIGRRVSADFRDTHEHLRPRVMPYVYAYTDMGSPGNFLAMRAIQFAMVALLMLVCVNVAILVYARTATRLGEIAVRGALGASRLRIIAQLFVEALTLAGVAAVIGVVMLSVTMPYMENAFLNITGGRLPFWMQFQIAADDLIFVVSLTLLAAGLVGVLPALKATRKDVHARLQTLSPGSGSRMQMGRLWTLLIVAQVAVTVALLPAAMYFTLDGLRLRTGTAGFASGEVLSATVDLDRPSEQLTPEGDATFASRSAAVYSELVRRLRGDPSVVDVTFSRVDAGNELAMVVQGEDQVLPLDPADYNIVAGTKDGHLARYNRVAVNFFDAFGVPVSLGRGFRAADTGTGVVIVNRAFGNAVFGSDGALGRRIKYVGRSREADEDHAPLEQWYEVVGMVPDFPANEIIPALRVYHPAAAGELLSPRIGVRVRATDPETFSRTLRTISGAVDPSLQLRRITTIDTQMREEQSMFRVIGVTVGLVMISIVSLSAAGIYALMSFTVARRRKEIGIRAALGADRHRLLAGIFARVLAQLGAGVVVGLAAAIGLEQLIGSELVDGYRYVILPLVAVVMSIVGVAAAYGPARQGLRIQPTEALREE